MPVIRDAPIDPPLFQIVTGQLPDFLFHQIVVKPLRGFGVELKQGPADVYTLERLEEMSEFFETTTALYREVSRLPAGTLRQAAKMKSRWKKLLGSGKTKS